MAHLRFTRCRRPAREAFAIPAKIRADFFTAKNNLFVKQRSFFRHSGKAPERSNRK
jgi:hypothetical protein